MERVKALLIEDNPGDALMLRALLDEVPEAATVELVHVDTLCRGLSRLKSEHFDVVLLDLNLPDSMGLDTLSGAVEEVRDKPIVVLTGIDETLGVEAVRRGAQDYLVKGQCTGKSVVRTIGYACERKRLEVELQKARDELELRFRQRTLELDETIAILGEEVTDRVETAEALRETEQLLKWMADELPEALMIATGDLGQVLYVNAAWDRVWGQSRDDLIRQPQSFLELIHPKDRPAVQNWLNSRLETGLDEGSECEFRVVKPQGGAKRVRGRVFMVRDERGRVRRICGIWEELNGNRA